MTELTQIVHDVAHLATGGESAPVQRVALCAASTLALCNGNPQCNIDDVLDQALPSCAGDEQELDALRRHSRSVASGLMAMFPFGDDPADFETRAGHAVDAVAELACVAWSTTDDRTTPSSTRCDDADLLSEDPASTDHDHRNPRLLMRSVRVVHAFLHHDPTAVALEATHAVIDALVFLQAPNPGGPASADQLETRRDQSRALRLVGGLLTYASTYETRDGQTTADVIAQGHDERRQILESLSSEFTSRDQRDGDWIVSFGGSLRLNGGVRFFNPDGPDAGTTFWGPASLVLGMALDYAHEPVGFHLELGAFDLGQYLSFGDSVTLRTPSPAAAISPSITLGISFGLEVPFFLGATFGGSPFQPEVNGTDGGHRVLYVGGVAGFYVPLFDLN
jgi:hypothetical protein